LTSRHALAALFFARFVSFARRSYQIVSHPRALISFHVKHFGTIDGREKNSTSFKYGLRTKATNCGRSKDAAAYIMDKEVVRRDQFDPAED
jgi:hypothetical protein